MIRTVRLALPTLAILGASAIVLGCRVKVEPLTRYNGTTIDKSVAVAGKNVNIANPNGAVSVDATSTSDQLTVRIKPFDMEASDDAGRQTAIQKMSNTLQVTVDDTTGEIKITGNGTGYLGADLEVHLPSSFAGALALNVGSGEVNVTGSGSATSTIVTSHAGGITAANLTRHVELTVGAGDIVVSASPSGGGNFYRTDAGNITASIATASNLTISAKTKGGTVTVPATWNANVAEDNTSAGITLGDGTGALDVSTLAGSITFFGN